MAARDCAVAAPAEPKPLGLFSLSWSANPLLLLPMSLLPKPLDTLPVEGAAKEGEGFEKAALGELAAHTFGDDPFSNPLFCFCVLVAELAKGDGELRVCAFDWPNTPRLAPPAGFAAVAKGLAEGAGAKGFEAGALFWTAERAVALSKRFDGVEVVCVCVAKGLEAAAVANGLFTAAAASFVVSKPPKGPPLPDQAAGTPFAALAGAPKTDEGAGCCKVLLPKGDGAPKAVGGCDC